MRNFVVFSLPRSRSTWLSVFLSTPQARCGHDIAPTLDRPEDFASRLSGETVGTCETGAAFAWPLIRKLLPDARFVVIRRPVFDVMRSLAQFGMMGLDLLQEMERREADLAAISAEPGTLTVDFGDLSRASACSEIYRHCLGREMPLAWWAQLNPLNIQIDMDRQLAMLAARRPQIEALKAAARERLHA